MKTWLVGLVLASAAATSPAQAALYWTPWVSEEGGSPDSYCSGWDEGAVGFGCWGSYCDWVHLLCETYPYGITASDPTYWSGFFSEERSNIETHWSAGWYPWDGDNYEVCYQTWNAGIVMGIQCNGSYCDNISIECGRPVKHKNGTTYNATLTSCSWTSTWYSEEHGDVDFGWNRYIAGIECGGSYCDNKRYFVCSLVDPAP